MNHDDRDGQDTVRNIQQMQGVYHDQDETALEDIFSRHWNSKEALI